MSMHEGTPDFEHAGAHGGARVSWLDVACAWAMAAVIVVLALIA